VRNYKGILLLLFFIYILYLFIEKPLIELDDPYNYDQFQKVQLDKHKQAIASISNRGETLKGIILGGSNAVSGISARQLSNDSSGKLFYNYSLSGSKNKINIYLDSLREISSLIDSEAIKVVVFSDIMFFLDKNSLESHKPKLKIFPSVPLLQYMRYKLIPPDPPFIRDIVYGDIDSEGSYSEVCKAPERFSMIPNNPENIKQRHLKIKNVIQEIFPNSRVYFMVPAITDDSSNQILKYLDQIKAIYKESNLELILIKPRSEKDIFCYSGYYLNQKGRTLITNEIIEIIRTY